MASPVHFFVVAPRRVRRAAPVVPPFITEEDTEALTEALSEMLSEGTEFVTEMDTEFVTEDIPGTESPITEEPIPTEPGTEATTEGPPETSDPHWSNVQLLMGFDGSNGATSTVDEGPLHRTITRNGSVVISTATADEGTGSSSHLNNSNNYWSTPIGDGFRLGLMSAFTLEVSLRLNVGSGNAIMYGCWNSNQSSTDWSFRKLGTSLQFNWRPADGSPIETNISYDSFSMDSDRWYKLCVEYDGTYDRLYIDGVMVKKQLVTEARRTNGANPLQIGRVAAGSPIALNGYLDEIRITSNVARYANDSGYTPRTGKFPRGAPPEFIASVEVQEDSPTADELAFPAISEVEDGDLLVAYIAHKGGGAVVDTPAGWTKHEGLGVSLSGQSSYILLFAGVASSYAGITFNLSTPGAVTGHLVVLRGAIARTNGTYNTSSVSNHVINAGASYAEDNIALYGITCLAPTDGLDFTSSDGTAIESTPSGDYAPALMTRYEVSSMAAQGMTVSVTYDNASPAAKATAIIT